MRFATRWLLLLLVAGASFALLGETGSAQSTAAPSTAMEFIRVADDKRSFALAESKQKFVVWGVNYDHDETGRLLEDYWETEWLKVEEDFVEIKALGANVVRIHLQVGKFMEAADKPRQASLDRLGKLLALAEKNGLYLDLTGLGCYHKADVPAWYDKLDEAGRWQAQAVFWEAIAAKCAASPAVFCYDLMNEPVVPGGNRPGKDWLGPAFGGKHFVQYISLDRAGRERPDVARAWIEKLVAAIRKHDQRHLVTVGLVDWSLDRPGLTSGFVPQKVCEPLDFVAVHIYPETGKLDEALETLRGFAIGKPVLIEETFGLKCSAEEWGKFVDASKPQAAGWVGFYWGKPRAEYKQAKTIGEAITGAWLAEFEQLGAEMTKSQ
jgi:hypothetical protein